jgi:hypothetical protein
MDYISKLINQYPHIRNKNRVYSIGNIFDDNSETYIYKSKTQRINN